MNRALAKASFLAVIVWTVTFFTYVIIYKVSPMCYLWRFETGPIVVWLPIAVEVFFFLLILSLMFLTKSFSWMTLFNLFSTLVLCVIFIFITNTFVAFGTKIFILYLSLILIGFAMHSLSFFIWLKRIPAKLAHQKCTPKL